MNFLKFINRQENLFVKMNLESKNSLTKKIRKNSIISLGYHEYDKEEIRLENYRGACLKFKSNNLNSKLVLRSKLDKEVITLNFFFYNPFLFDIHKES